MSLISISIEKHCLAGIFQNPEVLADVDGFLSEKDFYVQPHNVIYSCLRNLILANEKPDKVLLAQKIMNLGISFKENINIFDYVSSITFAPITAKATIQACQELCKLRALRDIEAASKEIIAHVNKAANNSLEQTVTEVDSIYSKTINSFTIKDKVEDLFETMYEDIETTGNNIVSEIGISTPFPDFNRLYGGLREGNAYIFVSRPKSGKTTFLNYLMHEISRIHKINCLIVDTEMSSKEIRFRTAAAITEIPLWHLETGNWRHNQDYVDKVRKGEFPLIKNKYRVHHIGIGNMSTQEVCSVIRRWHMMYVGRGNKSVVAYDYIKLSDKGDLDNNWAEHQSLGEKLSTFKNLGMELRFPFVTAGQANRGGENAGKHSKDVTDDGSVVAASDRLNWFASYIGLLRRKTQDEYLLDTPESGTHLLKELFARYLGRDAGGHQDWIKREMPDGEVKYVRNYINYLITNFKVTEKGTILDSIARQNAQFKLTDDKTDNSEVL